MSRDMIRIDTTGLSALERSIVNEELGRPASAPPGMILIGRDGVVRMAPRLRLLPGFDEERFGETISDQDRFLIRGSQERIHEPHKAAVAVLLRAEQLETRCKTLPPASTEIARCERRTAALRHLGQSLTAPVLDRCQAAAAAYARHAACPESGCRSDDAQQAFRAVDDHCMASLSTHPTPQVFRPDGALAAVVLIQTPDGTGGWSHLCGGLLLSGGRVLTARHCFEGYRAAQLRGKQIRAVRLSDEKPFTLNWTDGPITPPRQVADDFIVVPLADGEPHPTPPRVVFQAVDEAKPAFALGYFIHHDTTRQPLSSQSRAARGLRWSRPELCHVIETVSGCVRTVCQTAPGFSGGPLFSAERDPGTNALIVYGVVSQAQTGRALPCDALALPMREGDIDVVSTSATFPAGVAP